MNILAGKLTPMAFSSTFVFMRLTEDCPFPMVDGIICGAEYVGRFKDSEATMFIRSEAWTCTR
ncbi:MAG: hypothetical protein ACE5IJ_03845 [Thermoplasmata archaeon]